MGTRRTGVIAMGYENILTDPLAITRFFSGTTGSPHSYDKTNWIYGCEDLEYHNGRVWTVTEFPSTDLPNIGNKALYSADYNHIYNLMRAVP